MEKIFFLLEMMWLVVILYGLKTKNKLNKKKKYSINIIYKKIMFDNPSINNKTTLKGNIFSNILF